MDKNEENDYDKQKIVQVDLEREMKKSYIDYAMSVIVSRALPDVRDGMKPVHRRIIYSMNELSLWQDKPYRKSAGIVGDVMGKYHPHGDASIYDALVRLAQPFSLRYPLVDGHGNFGSIDNDPPAAMRYTEARLEKISYEMIEDLEKDTVDFVPNYDDRLKEPSVLPAKLPNLLLNGSYGIAVGMACNIPPHNLCEVVDGVCAMVDNPEITDLELMKYIKGPDFPTAGIILGDSGIRDAYTTGKGKITVRAKTDIEEDDRGRFKIVITELPYQVCKANLVSDIARLVQTKVIEGISDLRDESDREGLRVVVDLKKDANPNVILNLLYKHTALQSNISMLMLALVDNQPKVLRLSEIIGCYLKHREEVVLRRTKFDLDKAQARLHILEGLRIALDNIDEIVKIIRSSKADADAKAKMSEKFGLTDVQCQAILDMRLKTLTGLQREKIDSEYEELLKQIAEFESILASEEKVKEIIKKEALELKEKYGDERKTAISYAEGSSEIDIESLIQKEDVVVTMSHLGYIKRMGINTYRTQRRGGKGVTAMNTREEDFVERVFIASTHANIVFITDKGKSFRLKCYDIPEASRTAKGTAAINLLHLEQGEKVVAVVPVEDFNDESKYLLIGTKKGLVKKSKLTLYANMRKIGIQAVKLREDDEVISAKITDGTCDIIIVTKNGQDVVFSEDHVRDVGRNSSGVKGITLKGDDYVVGLEAINEQNKKEDTLLIVTENGFGKRTDLSEYTVHSRGGKGMKVSKLTERTGAVIGLKLVSDKDDLMMITDTGVMIRLHVKDISVIGRVSQGVTLMRTSENGKVIAIAKVENDEEEEQ